MRQKIEDIISDFLFDKFESDNEKFALELADLLDDAIEKIVSECTDNAYQDGYVSGKEEGYNSGYEEGYNSGYDDGYNSGYDDGYDYGYDDGYDSGCYDGLSD